SMRSLVLLLLGGTTGCAASAAATPRETNSASHPWSPVLPRGVRGADVVPGRYAATFDYDGTTSCSMSWASSSSRATVVLELAADGKAAGCRGRTYHSIEGANDEYVPTQGAPPPSPPHETKYVEQQAMRGRWRRDVRSIVVDLDLDTSSSSARAQGATP